MKQLYILLLTICCLLLTTQLSYSQQFKWLTGGGSTDFSLPNEETITHMCTDDNGNVYTLAEVGERNIKADTFSQTSVNARGSQFKILFMSHDCDGNMRFAKLLQSSQNNRCHGLAYHNGMVYVAGDLYDEDRRIGYDDVLPDGWEFSFTAKFDTSGNYYWTKFIGPDSFSTLQASFSNGSVAVDGQGNIHRYATVRAGLKFTSTLTSQWGSYDLKYDPNGNLLSVVKLQDIDSGYYVISAKIDKTTDKSYILFGYTGGAAIRSGNVLSAYNTNGTQIWKDTTNPRNGIGNFRIIPGNGIYFTGGASQLYPFTLKGMTVSNTISPTGYVAVIGKLDIANGNPQWMHHIDGANAILPLYDITILPDYSIATVGTYAGFKKYRNDTVGMPMGANYRPMLFVIDTAGTLIDWTWMDGTDFYNSGRCITSDKKGNVYVGGELSLALQAGNLPSYNTNGGNSDFFISKFGFDCNCTSMANPTSAFTYTITDSLKKELKFNFTGTTPNDSVVWRFGDGSVLTQTNPTHIFADSGMYTVCAKVMVPCGRKVICQDIYVPYKDTTTDTPDNVMVVNALDNVKIYPNPAHDVLHIDGLEAGSRIELYDIVGRKMHMITTAKENEIVNISYLPEGNYIIQLTDNRGRRMTGKVVKRAPRP